MYYGLGRQYYWLCMAASAMATLRSYRSCASDRVELQNFLNRFKLFSAFRPLRSAGVDILGLHSRTKHGKRSFYSSQTDLLSRRRVPHYKQLQRGTLLPHSTRPRFSTTAHWKWCSRITERSLHRSCRKSSVSLWVFTTVSRPHIIPRPTVRSNGIAGLFSLCF